jgi:hypothetical protein
VSEFRCAILRGSDDFTKLVDLDQRVFGTATLSRASAEAIFHTRPELYSAVFDPDGEVAGYLDIYPLRRECARMLRRGHIGEAELHPGMLLGRSENHDRCDLYIGSLVIAGRYDPIVKSALLSALLKLRLIHMRALKVGRVNLLMSIASARGERLARRLGARKIQEGGKRRDGLDLYSGYTTQSSLAAFTAAMSPHPVPSILLDAALPFSVFPPDDHPVGPSRRSNKWSDEIIAARGL